MNLESGGAALGARQTLEDEYEAQALPEVEKFLSDVQQAALVGALSAVAVMALWASLLSRLTSRGASSTLTDALGESPIPTVALAAAQFTLARGAEANLTRRQLRQALASDLGLTADTRGKLTAADGALSWEGSSSAATRTAATADFGDSMLTQLSAEGYTHKRWMTRYDLIVRDTHAAADRQTVLLDEPFIVGGIALRYPGDPMAADVSEVINCRCVLVGVLFGDRPLDKPAGTEPWNDPYPG